MNAVVLVAGVARRMAPLSDTTHKALLPVGGRPVLDRILDKVEELDDVNGVHVVTNSFYAAGFEKWSDGRSISIHDDGT